MHYKGKRSKADILSGASGVVLKSRVIGNNTVEYSKDNGDRVIRLHDTDIITQKKNGDIVLDSGGWQTLTTKDRMNKHLAGVSIYQEKSIWYVVTNGDRYVYQDGMILHANGAVSGAGEVKDLRKMQKRIKEYVDGYCKKLFAREIPAPSGGDCWFCHFQTQDGKSMGEVSRNSDHLLSHFDEKYFVPSLLVNALEDCGSSQATRHCVGYWLHIHEDRAEFWEEFAQRDVSKMLKRHLKRQLGLAK